MESPAPRNMALIRLKKRSRTLLVASCQDDEASSSLVAFLHAEGYGKVLEASTLGELLGALDEPGVGLLFLDAGIAELQGLDLVETLHQVREELPPILLALEAPSAEDVVGAHEAGVARLVVKPFVLDEDFSKLMESLLGI